MNTNRIQFNRILTAYEANKHLDNDLCIVAMSETEPTIKITTMQVYRSNIENYVCYNTTSNTMGKKLIDEMKQFYKSNDTKPTETKDSVLQLEIDELTEDNDALDKENDRLIKALIQARAIITDALGA